MNFSTLIGLSLDEHSVDKNFNILELPNLGNYLRSIDKLYSCQLIRRMKDQMKVVR